MKMDFIFLVIWTLTLFVACDAALFTCIEDKYNWNLQMRGKCQFLNKLNYLLWSLESSVSTNFNYFVIQIYHLKNNVFEICYIKNLSGHKICENPNHWKGHRIFLLTVAILLLCPYFLEGDDGDQNFAHVLGMKTRMVDSEDNQSLLWTFFTLLEKEPPPFCLFLFAFCPLMWPLRIKDSWREEVCEQLVCQSSSHVLKSNRFGVLGRKTKI